MFDIQVSLRDGMYVASCPQLGAEAIGDTEEKAISVLVDVAERAFRDIIPVYRHTN